MRRHERAERNVTICCAAIDLREQPLRLPKVAGHNESLDRSRADELGLVPVGLADVAEKRGCVLPARRSVVARQFEDRERNPQAKRAPSEPAGVEDVQQLRNRFARLVGFTSVRVDLRKDSNAKRLEHLQPDLTRQLDRLLAQLRSRVPGAACHLRLRPVEQAPDHIRVCALSRLGGQRAPQLA